MKGWEDLLRRTKRSPAFREMVRKSLTYNPFSLDSSYAQQGMYVAAQKL
jgi:hypothetical protein